MIQTEHGLKKHDSYQLDTGLEIMDTFCQSMEHEMKRHNHNVIEKHFESCNPMQTLKLPRFKGQGNKFVYIIELQDGIDKVLGYIDEEPPSPAPTQEVSN